MSNKKGRPDKSGSRPKRHKRRKRYRTDPGVLPSEGAAQQRRKRKPFSLWDRATFLGVLVGIIDPRAWWHLLQHLYEDATSIRPGGNFSLTGRKFRMHWRLHAYRYARSDDLKPEWHRHVWRWEIRNSLPHSYEAEFRREADGTWVKTGRVGGKNGVNFAAIRQRIMQEDGQPDFYQGRWWRWKELNPEAREFMKQRLLEGFFGDWFVIGLMVLNFWALSALGIIDITLSNRISQYWAFTNVFEQLYEYWELNLSPGWRLVFITFPYFPLSLAVSALLACMGSTLMRVVAPTRVAYVVLLRWLRRWFDEPVLSSTPCTTLVRDEATGELLHREAKVEVKIPRRDVRGRRVHVLEERWKTGRVTRPSWLKQRPLAKNRLRFMLSDEDNRLLVVDPATTEPESMAELESKLLPLKEVDVRGARRGKLLRFLVTTLVDLVVTYGLVLFAWEVKGFHKLLNALAATADVVGGKIGVIAVRQLHSYQGRIVGPDTERKVGWLMSNIAVVSTFHLLATLGRRTGEKGAIFFATDPPVAEVSEVFAVELVLAVTTALYFIQVLRKRRNQSG